MTCNIIYLESILIAAKLYYNLVIQDYEHTNPSYPLNFLYIYLR